MLFQLASLLNVKSIITKKQDSLKVISNIKKELSLNKTIQIEHTIAKTFVNDFCFMVFDSNGLKFASQKLLETFKCEGLEMVKSKICLELDLNKLLEEDSFEQRSYAFGLDEKKYMIQSKTSTISGEKFIYIEDISKEKCKDISGADFIKNRIYFIEILKEKIIEKSISQGLLGIITIEIENMSNLKNDWNEYEIEMAIRDLLLQVEIEIESHTLLAQYDNGLYLTLFEGLDFEALKQKATAIQNHITTYTSKQKIKPIIGLYAFDINDLELDNILRIVSDISKEKVSLKDVQTQKLHKLINIDDELDDARVIDMYLQAMFTNKTPLKLLNIYKGLCINTTSMIAKKQIKKFM